MNRDVSINVFGNCIDFEFREIEMGSCFVQRIFANRKEIADLTSGESWNLENLSDSELIELGKNAILLNFLCGK